MLEFILTDVAPLRPQNCAACQSQTGPFADTHRELVDGQVYICQLCAKRLARLFGFTKGERMDELEHAAGLLAERDRELELVYAKVSKIEPERDALLRALSDRDSDIRDVQATLDNAKEHLREFGTAALAVAGIGIGDPEMQSALEGERSSLMQALTERDAEIKNLHRRIGELEARSLSTAGV